MTQLELNVNDLQVIENNPTYFQQLKKSKLSRPTSSVGASRVSTLRSNSTSAFQRRKELKTSYTFSQQAADQVKGPGPGDYDVLKAFKSTIPHHSTSMSRTSHIVKDYKYGDKVGPQSYQTIKNTSTLQTVNGYMSTTPYTVLTNTVPGPGSYEMRSSIQISRGKFTTYQPDEKKVDDAPGPGSYRIQSQQAGPRYSIYPKRSDQLNKIPGPASYNVSSNWKNDSRFQSHEGSKFTRYFPVERVDNGVPGPGAYFHIEGPHPQPGLAWTFGRRCYKEEK